MRPVRRLTSPSICTTVSVLACQVGRGWTYHPTEDVAVRVDDVAGLVNTLASKDGLVDLGLGFGLGLRLGLPTLSVAELVALLVEDVTVLVDLLALELLGITLNQAANDVTVAGDLAVGLHRGIGEVLEGGGLLELAAVLLRDQLGLADDLASIVPDLALLVSLATNCCIVSLFS